MRDPQALISTSDLAAILAASRGGELALGELLARARLVRAVGRRAERRRKVLDDGREERRDEEEDEVERVDAKDDAEGYVPPHGGCRFCVEGLASAGCAAAGEVAAAAASAAPFLSVWLGDGGER